jgi:hypothetical protein
MAPAERREEYGYALWQLRQDLAIELNAQLKTEWHKTNGGMKCHTHNAQAS